MQLKMKTTLPQHNLILNRCREGSAMKAVMFSGLLCERVCVYVCVCVCV